MLRSRIIPCLLIHQGGLVKTVGFKDPIYIGDPINAVKIFNEKEADELIVLDIDSTVNGADPDYKLITALANECRMPLCYGGGIRTPEQAKRIIGLGVEKVAISSAALDEPSLISRISEEIGRQSVVVVLDVRKKTGLFAKGYDVYTHNGTKARKVDPVELATELEAAGAGELVLNSIDHDGMMKGYDLELAKEIVKRMTIPVTILGGAGAPHDIRTLFDQCGLVGAAAGSLFVFKGKYRAVLINYPGPYSREDIYSESQRLNQP